MKKFVVALAIVVLLLSGKVSQAVDLDEGWYASLAFVSLYGYDDSGPRLVEWNFADHIGAYGPFEVTEPGSLWPQRSILVLPGSTGVLPGTSVYLWGNPSEIVDYAVKEVSLRWETNYDAAKMRLELLSYSPSAGFELLWTQALSGYHWGYANVLTKPWLIIPVGYQPVFRVTVVPEPSGLYVLIVGAGAFRMLIRRRRV